MRPVLATVLIALVWSGTASTTVAEPSAPDTLFAFSDPAGDVRITSASAGVPMPEYEYVDMTHVTVTRGDHPIHGDVLLVTHRVVDLADILIADVGISDIMYGLNLDVSGTDWPGEWTTRADYIGTHWRFWAEGPCLDPQPNGGCAGEDRNIHDHLPGTVSYDDNEVTVVMPLGLLGNVDGGHATVDRAFTDAVWPTWPIYVGDRAQDLSGTHAFF